MELKDLKVYLYLQDLEGTEAVSKALTFIKEAVTNSDATLIQEDQPKLANYIIVPNATQAKVAALLNPDAQLASPMWLCATMDAKKVLPLDSHPLYKPFPVDFIAGNKEKTASISGFSSADLSRRLAILLLKGMGFIPTLSLSLDSPPFVLVVANVEETSKKTDAARQDRAKGIPMVSLQWVIDSLTQQKLLPFDGYNRRNYPVQYIFDTPRRAAANQSLDLDDDDYVTAATNANKNKSGVSNATTTTKDHSTEEPKSAAQQEQQQQAGGGEGGEAQQQAEEGTAGGTDDKAGDILTNGTDTVSEPGPLTTKFGATQAMDVAGGFAAMLGATEIPPSGGQYPLPVHRLGSGKKKGSITSKPTPPPAPAAAAAAVGDKEKEKEEAQKPPDSNNKKSDTTKTKSPAKEKDGGGDDAATPSNLSDELQPRVGGGAAVLDHISPTAGDGDKDDGGGDGGNKDMDKDNTTYNTAAALLATEVQPGMDIDQQQEDMDLLQTQAVPPTAEEDGHGGNGGGGEEQALEEQEQEEEEEFVDAVEEAELTGSLGGGGQPNRPATEEGVVNTSTVDKQPNNDANNNNDDDDEEEEEEETSDEEYQAEEADRGASLSAVREDEEEEEGEEGVAPRRSRRSSALTTTGGDSKNKKRKKSADKPPPAGRNHSRKQKGPARATWPQIQDQGAVLAAAEEEEAAAATKGKRGRPGKAAVAAVATTKGKSKAKETRGAAKPAQEEEEEELSAAPASKKAKTTTTKKAATKPATKTPPPARKSSAAKTTTAAKSKEAGSTGKKKVSATKKTAEKAPKTTGKRKSAAAIATDDNNADSDIGEPQPKKKGKQAKHTAVKGSKAGVCVALSGWHSDQQAELASKLKALKIPCVVHSQTDTWQPHFTHIVAPGVKRNVKCCAALASGTWLLSDKFITESSKEGELVNEETYEIYEPPAVGAGEPGLPAHWRKRYQETSMGAFASLRVAIAPLATGEAPKKEFVKAMIEAGDGEVVPLSSPKDADVVVASAEEEITNAAVQRLVRGGVPCVGPRFFVEWLFQPKNDLKSHLLLKSNYSVKLRDLLKQRSQGLGGNEPFSPQF